MTHLKKKLQANELTIGSWITLGHPAIAEIMARSGFTWLTVDLEHSVITIREAEDLIRTIDLVGKTPLVRLSSNDSVQIKRVMDAGAKGVIVPMVNSVEDAKKAVSAVYYPKIGTRGVGLARAQGYGTDFAGYRKRLETEAVVIAQIEHIEAVQNLEEILSVEGIDAFIVGPYDLSASMGIPGEFQNAEFLAALARIQEVSKKLKKTGGYHVVEPNPAELERRIHEGYRFLAYSLDTRMLDTSCRGGLAKMERLF